MRKTLKNLILLNVIFGVSLVISNVVTSKLINTGITLFNTPVTLPGAAVCYAITFLMTDVIGEIWGKEEAQRTVYVGFVGQVIATCLILLTQYLPAADEHMQLAYNSLLGQNYIFVIGSLVAYFASQSWDVFIFHKIRDKWLLKHDSTSARWIWNNASTMTSQIIDTVLFIGISFGIGFGWLFNPEMYPTFFAMLLGQYFIKFILAALDTPFFYLMTKENKVFDLTEE